MATATGKYRILGVEHAEIITRLTAWATGSPPVLGTMASHDLHFINNVGFDVQQQDIAFEGDQQSVRKFFMNGIVVNVVCDTFDLKAISEAFDKDVVVGTGSSGNHITTGVKRVYFGDSVETAGVKVGLMAQIKAENLTDQTIETLQFVVPVASLTVVRPPVLAYNAKAVMNLTFTAEKTTTDIALNPLAEVPADGTFWYLDATPPA